MEPPPSASLSSRVSASAAQPRGEGSKHPLQRLSSPSINTPVPPRQPSAANIPPSLLPVSPAFEAALRPFQAVSLTPWRLSSRQGILPSGFRKSGWTGAPTSPGL